MYRLAITLLLSGCLPLATPPVLLDGTIVDTSFDTAPAEEACPADCFPHLCYEGLDICNGYCVDETDCAPGYGCFGSGDCEIPCDYHDCPGHHDCNTVNECATSCSNYSGCAPGYECDYYTQTCR